MNYLLKKFTSISLALVLFLSTPLSLFAYNLDMQDSNYSLNEFEDIFNNEFDTYDLTDEHIKILEFYNQYQDTYEDNNERKILITVATIRAALTKIGASQKYIPVTTHALDQMNKRAFTSDSVAKLMNSGSKYTDNRGSKILYDASSKTALVVDQLREPVITALDKVDLTRKILDAGWRLGW